MSSADGPITKEQAERFNQCLAELIRQGAASVPAIREFLERNIEYYYAGVSGGDQLSYPSLRASLIDALKQIGGPEAQAAMLEALRTIAMPSELLALANNLDQQAPGQYRGEIVNAARETLAMAATNQLGTNVELGPAFRILGTYGAANTVADVAKGDPGSFDNAIALAGLPDGQGLPSLIQMAENPSADGSGQSAATAMIAQLACQNPDALVALAAMAQEGQISNSAWVRLAPILGGDQYQPGGSTASGGQDYVVVNVATTPDQINQRITVIDALLGFVAPDSSAASALQHQRDVLVGKLGN